MAQQAPRSSRLLRVLNKNNLVRLLLLQATLSATAVAQSPQQQYVYGSVPVTTSTSQISAYGKNAGNGTLSGVAGAPFSDTLQGGAMAIDGLGHFLFVINPSTSNISMLQINQNTGGLVEVPGSPFLPGPLQIRQWRRLLRFASRRRSRGNSSMWATGLAILRVEAPLTNTRSTLLIAN